jgi:SAM-dependent methyltransferase
MSKKRDEMLTSGDFSSNYQMTPREAQVASRFNQQYRGATFELPEEVEAMPIFQEWISGTLAGRISSNFWEIAQPKKNQRCLDIGCGVSFLIYPWRDWDAFFYGQEISTVAQEALNARGSQLNSKLFKGVSFGGARQLNYESGQFDLAIATGWSCYYPLEDWSTIFSEVKRVLKPEGQFVFDVLNPVKPLAEDWAVLEMYLGSEVFLDPIADWEKMIKSAGAKVIKRQSGELFDLYLVRF